MYSTVCLLNGERPNDPLTPIVDAVRGALPGSQVDVLTLHQQSIKHCLGCFDCWVKSPGQCIIDDDNRDVARCVINADLVVFLSPVTFGGYSADLKLAVDHLISLIMPYFKRVDGEIHHKPRYETYPDLLGVGVMPAPNPRQAELFTHLVEANGVNMQAKRRMSTVLYRNKPSTAWQTALRHALNVEVA